MLYTVENYMFTFLRLHMSTIDLLQSINAITKLDKINPKIQLVMNKHPDVLERVTTDTSFLNVSATLRERVWCIQNNVLTKPICSGCGSDTSFNKQKRRFNEYCSHQCAWSDVDTNVDKGRTTKTDKYGDPNYNNRDAARKTNLDKFGTESPAKNTNIRRKMMESWSGEKRQQANEKRINTNIDRYGASSYAGSAIPQHTVLKLNDPVYMRDLVINKALTMNQISELLDISTHSVRSSIDRHNILPSERDDLIKSIASRYVNIKPSIAMSSRDTDELVEQFNLSPIELSKILGCTPAYVYNHQDRPTFSNIKHSGSSHESDVLEFIKTLIPSDRIITNDRSVIPPYELDVYIPELSLAIEYNGVYWHSESAGGKDRKYHKRKHRMCRELGIQLIQIYSSEWINNTDLVKSRLLCKLTNTATKIYARKCVIKDVTTSEERAFLKQNHIQGYVASSYCYGLYSDGVLVSLMSFGKTRYSTEGFELLRLATATNVVVVGGASKLFTAFVREHNPQKIVSYCMLRWNVGTVYEQLGFNHVNDTEPNYHYFKTNNTSVLMSRVKFQKHKLSTILDHFDPNLTEWENMVNNGYDRIWDCGNGKWVWERD